MIQKDWVYHRICMLLFLSLLGISPSLLQAQAVIGAREIGLGQATTALTGSPWAVFSNPAMIKEETDISFFGVQYYGLAEIRDMASSLTLPTQWGLFAVGIHRYGFDLFSESRFRIGYKNSFKTFHYGGIINYNHVAQGGGYGSVGALGLDIGVAAPLAGGLWMGAKATNINQPTYGGKGLERLPRNLSVGLSYLLTGRGLITADVLKDSGFSARFRGGLEVTVNGGLRARAGVTTAPQTFAGGFGYRGSTWSTNLAVHRHENPLLGYSPAIDFNIFW